MKTLNNMQHSKYKKGIFFQFIILYYGPKLKVFIARTLLLCCCFKQFILIAQVQMNARTVL